MTNDKEILKQVLGRADILKRKKAVRDMKMWSASIIAASFALIIGMATSMPTLGQHMPIIDQGDNAMMGAVLFNSPVAGYITIGVVAFVLGAAVTILCYKWNRKIKK